MRRPSIHSFLLLVLLFGCVEPFNPDLPSAIDNSELVVEGFITDYEAQQTVRLSRTQAVGDLTPPQPETGAIVTLLDNLGNEFIYRESEPGVYNIDTATFQAENGNSYQISILLSNGESFSSDFQELKSSIPIDTAWWRVESETIIVNELPLTREFVNIFTFLDESEEVLITYNGRYEVFSPLQGSGICFQDPPEPGLIPSNLLCYWPDQSNDPLNILSGSSVVNPQNTERNIISIENDRRFSRAFSILLEKFTLTDSYFDFLEELKEQTENAGIFAPPPTEVFGNIRSNTDPNRVARGFFTTSSKTERRIFVDDIFFSNPNDPFCIPSVVGGISLPPRQFCCDCRLFPGAISVQPPYWGD